MFAIGPKSPLYGVLDDVLSGKINGNIATLKWALGQLAYPEAVLEKLVESLKEVRMIHCLYNGPLSKVYPTFVTIVQNSTIFDKVARGNVK